MQGQYHVKEWIRERCAHVIATHQDLGREWIEERHT